MTNVELERYLNQLLCVEQYSDYAPNGLQVEGRKRVQKIVCGVTASQALIYEAIRRDADAILVHHGYFWKGEGATITGIKQRRIKALLAHGINLYAYHLPLDGHSTLGNNAQLAKLWQIDNAQPTGEYELMWTGGLPAVSVEEMEKVLSQTLDRKPLVITGGGHKINKIAWCSGGAQGFLEQAVALGADAYVSGEVSEKTYHEAKEYGIHYFAAGHHATERGGVMAIAEHLSSHLSLSCEFVEINNPV